MTAGRGKRAFDGGRGLEFLAGQGEDNGRETDCQQGRPIVDGRVMAVKGGEIKEPGIFILALTCSEIRKKR